MTKKKYLLHLLAVAAVLSSVLSCGHQQQDARKQTEADSLINAASDARDYERVLTLCDSLEQRGDISLYKAAYERGFAYYYSGKPKAQQKELRQALLEKPKNTEDSLAYFNITYQLADALWIAGDDGEALQLALPSLEGLRKMDREHPSKEVTIRLRSLTFLVGKIQMSLGMKEEADKMFEECYGYLLKIPLETPGDYKRRFRTLEGFITSYNNAEDMASVEEWLARQDSVLALIKEGRGLAPADSDMMMGQSYLHHADVAAFLNRPEEFNRAVAAFRTTKYAQSNLGKSDLATALLEAKHYAEAADEYAVLDQDFAERGLELSLFNLNYYGEKFRANYKAGRIDTALAVANFVFENLDPAITEQQKSNAAELATIYQTHQKDAEIAQQQISLTRQRWLGTLVALILLTTFFIVYTLYRRRAQKRLAAAHEKLEVAHAELKSAYDQLEETTAAKERIESELQVASNIQMSMVPHKFPERPEIDIYASMIPAKEVGGDLYDFFLKDDTLYFCIGDVSGKGVPASLLMTVTTSQFRTVSRYLDQPEQIMMAINNQIAEGNDALMFVTMIIGCLDLKTGHLAYSCGAHNPPLLIGSSVEKLPVSHKVPVGVMKGMKYVFQETQISLGTTLFLYTDGLTEAMNAEQKLFGNDRMVETAQRLISDGVSTSKSLISGMSDAVEAFVTGADQSDDLTMMAIRFNG